MSAPDFRFPTSSNKTVTAFQLQADLVDRADGHDDVDEAKALDKSFAKDTFAHGRAPGVQQLADIAAGLGSGLEHAAAAQAGPVFIGHPPAKVTWDALRQALHMAEDSGGLDERGVAAAFTSLGFVRDTKAESKAGCLVFERDDRAIGVRLHQLGVIRVAEVAVEKRKGKRKGC